MERIIRFGKDDVKRDRDEWMSRPVAERIAAVEMLRRTCYAIAGFEPLPRLKREITLRPPFERPS